MYFRKLVLPFLILSLGILCMSGCQATGDNGIVDYCHTINQRLKDIDFFKAEVFDGAIRLYDNNDILIEEIPFREYDSSKEIVYIRKENSSLYFILSGSVDDERGIMFINDADNELLDGIHSIERIGGNSYEYSTS